MAEQFARERLPEEEPAESVPVLDLGECLDLYAALREQSQRLDEQVRALREQILEVMSARNLDEVRRGQYEVIRQVRRSQPKLDVARATEILKQHHRLQDCLVETLDERKARQVLEELRAAGEIARREIPLEPGRTVEALLIRPVDGSAEQSA